MLKSHNDKENPVFKLFQLFRDKIVSKPELVNVKK